jgi:tape measure domain-containing protein
MAGNIEFGIRLTADGRIFVGQLDLAKAKLKELGEAAGTAGQKTAAGLAQTDSAAKGAAESIRGVYNELKTLAVASGAIASVKHMAEVSDQAKLLQARLALVTTGTYEQAQANEALFQTAQKLQLPQQELANSYPRIARAIREYGGSTRDAIELTKIFAETVRISGATQEEAAASALQLSQAIASGRLQGDELRSILENNSRLALALAQGLGVTVGELRKLGEEGKLTSEKVVRALLSQKDVLEREASKLPNTIKGAWTVLANEADRATAQSATMNTAAGLLTLTLLGLAAAIKKVREANILEAIPIVGTMITAGKAVVGNKADGSANRAEDARFGRQAEAIRAQEAAKQAAERAYRDLTKEADTATGVNMRYVASVEKITEVWRQNAREGTLTAEKQRELTAQIEQEGVKRQVALSELAKKGQASFGTMIALLDQERQFRQAHASAMDTLEKDSSERSQRNLAASFANQLVAERAFIGQREALERSAAAQHVAALDAEIAAEQQLRQRVLATPARDASEQEQKKAKLVEIERKLMDLTVQRTVAERALGDVSARARERTYALDLKIFEAGNAILQETVDYVRTLKEQTDEDRFQLSLIGQTEAAQRSASAERQARLETEREIRRILQEITKLELAGADPTIIADRRRQIEEVRKAGEQRARDAKELAGQTAVATEQANILADAWHRVDDFLFEIMRRFKGNWRDAMLYAKQQLQQVLIRALYEMTLQRFGIQVFAAITGAGGGTFSGSGATSSLLGTAANWGADYLTGGTGGVWGALGSYASGAWGAAATQTVGAGASYGAGIGGAYIAAGEADAAAVASGLAEGIGWTGWGLIIAAAVYAIMRFAGSGGGPKVGGSYFEGGAVPGTDNGRFYTPNQGDSQARQLVDVTRQSYDALIAAFGGTAGDFKFGFGFDHDPHGDARSRVSSMVTDAKTGEILYSVSGREMDDKEVPGAATLEAQRMAYVALQHSGLEESVVKILNALDVKTASSDAITAATNLALTFHNILVEGAQDQAAWAEHMYGVLQGGARSALKEQGAALIQLAQRFDGSAQATQQLAQAQSAYRNSLLQLLVTIRQIQDELKDMFQSTRQRIQRAGMTDQELYNSLQAEADQRFARLQTLTDPAAVQREARAIDQIYNQAFDLLTPEEQIANRQRFLDNLTRIDDTVNARLNALFEQINEESKKPFEVVADKMAAAADKMLEAAQKITDAATIIRDNAGNSGSPSPIILAQPRASEVGVG